MRRQARRYALQSLYSWEINPEADSGLLEELITEKAEGNDLSFANSIISRVKEHQADLDAVISAHLKRWSLSQLNVVDKNILRIGLVELLYPSEKTELGVIIDEAVRLAKEFGGADSYRLVNGILAAIAKEKL